jgi:hypothetical protein
MNISASTMITKMKTMPMKMEGASITKKIGKNTFL